MGKRHHHSFSRYFKKERRAIRQSGCIQAQFDGVSNLRNRNRLAPNTTQGERPRLQSGFIFRCNT
jgi:hypothetical protein